MNQQSKITPAVANLTLGALREICLNSLAAGSHWRPSVVAEKKDGKWHWRDKRETTATHHGPFDTEKKALQDAVLNNEVDDLAVLGIAPTPSLAGVETALLLEELARRGALMELHGAVGALYDHLEREGHLGSQDKLTTYLTYRLRREDAAVCGLPDAKETAAHWQRKIDALDQTPATA